MKKYLKIFSFIALLLGVCQLSFAQLLIENSKVRKTVKPGETVVGDIFIHNNSPDAPFSIKAYMEDFKYLAPFDGKKEFLPSGTMPNSVTSWVTVSPQQFTVNPQSKQQIKYAINVPSDAKGGYYGVLFFERGDQIPSDQVGVNVIFRLGALFLIESENKDKNAKIKDIEARDGNLHGKLSNSGDVILFPKGIFYIMDGEGIVAERGELEKMYLPPGEEAAFTVRLPGSLKAGEYTVVLTFDLEEESSLVKEIDFKKSSGADIEITQQRD